MSKESTKLNKTENKLNSLIVDTMEMKETVAKRNIQLDSLITKVKGMLNEK